MPPNPKTRKFSFDVDSEKNAIDRIPPQIAASDIP